MPGELDSPTPDEPRAAGGVISEDRSSSVLIQEQLSTLPWSDEARRRETGTGERRESGTGEVFKYPLTSRFHSQLIVWNARVILHVLLGLV